MQVFARTFSSLKNPNFRYFWIGQCVSVMGTWIQRTAQTWLVYQSNASFQFDIPNHLRSRIMSVYVLLNELLGNEFPSFQDLS